MLVICSVTDTLSTPTISITEPPSVECQDLSIPNRSMHASDRGNRSVRTSVYSLFRRTRAAQNVALEGIRTRHLPHARQALYHYATAPLRTRVILSRRIVPRLLGEYDI